MIIGCVTNPPRSEMTPVRLLSSIVIALCCLTASVAAAADDFIAALTDVLRDHVDLQGGGVGIVAGVVDENGSRVASYGTLSRGSAATVNGDTLFDVDSITKTFTALLLQDMAERGDMALEDPVAKYLPPSVKTPTWQGKEITLLHLATHTSGLPAEDVTWLPTPLTRGYAGYTEEQLRSFLSSHTLIREPGTKYEYSNFGFGLLGHAIELKAKSAYESLVVDRICKPLGMESTRIALSESLRTRCATGYDWFGNRAEKTVSDTIVGCGGIYSTANDMLKYVAANIGLVRSPLTPLMEKTHALRLKLQPSDGAEGESMAWFSARDLIWHSGGNYAGNAFVGFKKKERRGVVILTNSPAGPGIYSLAGLLLNTEWRINTRPQVVPVDERIYDSYAGQYRAKPNYIMSVRREGRRLFAAMNSQVALQLLPQSTTQFFIALTGRSIEFILDDRGNVKALRSTLKGNSVNFSRIASTPAARPTRALPPMFVKVNSPALDAFVGRYQLPSGQIFSLKRRAEHLIMLTERRGGLDLYPESAIKASCSYFPFAVTLLNGKDGEVTGATVACAEPDWTGNARRISQSAR
jgi:CubicO group peptidase (beta-lactamase class C family)